MRKTRITQVAIAAVALLFSSSAWAQPSASERVEHNTFGQRGESAISAERLFGFVHVIQTTSFGGSDSTATTDSVSLFAGPFNGLISSYSVPRLAFDYFAATGVSLGVALGYQHASVRNESVDILLIAPRLGYAAMFNESIGIWPRLGVTYESASSSGQSANVYALTLEAPLVIAPASHAAFTVGPTLDLGLGGKSRSLDIKETDIGIQAGLLIYL